MPHTGAPERWTIGLSAWVIEDGNYPDFERGQIAEFAVSFDSEDRLQTVGDAATVSAVQVAGAFYDIVGRVTTAHREALVVHCGIEMYGPVASMPIADVGHMVRCRVGVEVDCYYYFERLYAIDGIPPLIHTWRIEAIEQQLTPFIEADDLALGRATHEYKSLERTNARDEDLAFYVLHCTRLDVPPKRASATAIPPMNKR